MARNNSFVKLEGTLDNLTFYRKNGENLVKTKSAISRSRIMNDPKFKRTRENMREFGGAATASKSFRTAFAGSAQKFGDMYMGSRMTGIMKRIVNSGPGLRGEREILIADSVDLIKGFEFNNAETFNSRFLRVAQLPVISPDRNSVVWDLDPFSPDRSVKAPEGATHFSIVFSAGYVSDFAYNTAEKAYKALSPEFDGRSGTAVSSPMLLSDALTPLIALEIVLATGDTIPLDVVFMVGIGITFYQEINNDLYEFAGGSVMKVAVTG
ncbi:MAG: hypothetical protein WA749_11235 [Gelidibacter sp.]